MNAITANTAKTGITSGQASAITANTAKVGITSAQASEIAENTMHQSDIATNTSNISTNTTNIATNTAKTGITSSQTSAITANTAKTGITSGQASAITTNTAKTGINNAQVEAINQISVNTELLSSYDSAITANTAKTGITSGQASAITANTAKTVLGLGTSSTTALAGNALSGTVNIGQTGATTTVLGTLNVDEAVTIDTTLSVNGGATFAGGTVTIVGADSWSADKIGFFGATAVVQSPIVSVDDAVIRIPYCDPGAQWWTTEIRALCQDVHDLRSDTRVNMDISRAKINELITQLQALGLID